MTGVDDDLLEDAGTPEIGDNALRSVAETAKRLRETDREIADLEQRLKDARAKRAALAFTELPDLMSELGLQSFKLDDGGAVEVRPVVRANISEARRAPAHDWLRANRHGDLIKTVVTAAFGRGKEDIAKALAEKAREVSKAVALKEAVHPQTLNKWAREMIEGGFSIPADIFGLFLGREAKITYPGQKATDNDDGPEF